MYFYFSRPGGKNLTNRQIENNYGLYFLSYNSIALSKEKNMGHLFL